MAEAGGTVRAFVAVTLPAPWLDALAALQDRLRPCGVRAGWTSRETMHLTLRFLGDVPEERVPALKTTLAEGYAARAPVRLQPRGAGAFPDLRRPSVLWAGVEALEGDLAALRAAADAAARAAGLPRDNKPFHPHITLGRVRRERPAPEALERLRETLHDARDWGPGAIDVDDVALFSSTLRPRGAVHRVLAAYALEGANPPCSP